MVLAVALAAARPLGPVTEGDGARLALAPLVGASNSTEAPETGLPRLSVTTTASGVANGAPTVADWPLPVRTVSWAGAPARLLRENEAVSSVPFTVAMTLYAPATVLAVASTFAAPLEDVVTLGALRLALAPIGGAVKLTVAPGIGLLLASRTSAASGVGNGAPAVTAWPLPVSMVMLAGAPGLLVSTSVPERLVPMTETETR